MNDVFKQLEEQVAAILPASCELSKVEVEGPQVVIYLKNMRAFYEDENFITKIASRLRKKVVVRADSSVLAPVEKALAHIKGTVPPEAGVKEVKFDPNFHEVLIEAMKPGLVIGKGGSVLKNIIVNTGWSPRVLRSPTMPCETIAAIRNSLLQQSEQRKKFLTSVGKKLYVAGKPSEWVKITALGGFREVGRSCFLLSTSSSNVIIDCGINVDPSDASKAYPYLNAMNLGLDQIDAVILSHAHLDHCLHPNSLVQLANGEVQRIEDLSVGGSGGAGVVSYDFVAGTSAAAVASKGATQKAEMLSIKTNLSGIRATPEHRFFVVEGLDVKEKRAGELRKGDFVAALRSNKFEGTAAQPLPKIEVQEFVQLSESGRKKMREKRGLLGLNRKQVGLKAGIPSYKYAWLESGKHKSSKSAFLQCIQALQISEKELAGEYSIVKNASLPSHSSEEFCQFLGYVLGDGNPHLPKPELASNDLAVTDKDVQNLEFYAQLAEKLFKTKPRFSLKASSMGGRNRVFFSSYVTKLLFASGDSILCRSRQRRIPEMIHRASNKELAAFFRGLFDAEGSVGHHSIRLVSSSEMLVRVAQMLLLRLGVLSSIEERLDASSKSFAAGPAYALTITHPASLRSYCEKIGFSSKAKAGKLEGMVAKTGKARAERIDLVPIDGQLLRQRLAEAGLYETDFDSRISRYWNESHAPSRAVVERMMQAIEARVSEIEGNASREVLRVTQHSLGRATGVSQKMISLIERGEVHATEEVSHKIEVFLSQAKQSRVEKARQLIGQLRMLCSEELVWAKIRKIESEVPPDKVYDLSVPGYENFVADGFIVHNSGFIPYLYAYGYEGPVYCTPPTRDMMVLLQQDCINVMNSEGGKAPYGERDVKKQLMHVITRDYGEVTDVTGDVRFTFHNAGHMVGSAMVHVHIGEGLHNLVYSGDLKYGKTRICDAATTVFPRAETFMIEATYGGRNDVKPRIEETEAKFCELISQVVSKRGKVLVPVIASGRAQEIMCVVEEHFKDPDFVVYIDGMSKEASAIHTAYPEYLRRTLQRRILQNDSPFDKPMFKNVENNDHRKQIAESGEPCVIIAPSGMLNGGPSLQFLKMLAHDPRNALVLVSYQSAMTVGRKIQQGEREIPIADHHASKQETLKVNMQVYSMEGFSGHSDRSQLLNFIRSVRPKPSRVFTMHGDGEKCDELARTINKMMHIETRVPMCLDSMRLK